MRHIPVMLDECLEIFKGRKILRFFDATLGAGGFAKAFLEEHPEVQTESEALASCESNRSYAGRMIFNNVD